MVRYRMKRIRVRTVTRDEMLDWLRKYNQKVVNDMSLDTLVLYPAENTTWVVSTLDGCETVGSGPTMTRALIRARKNIAQGAGGGE